MIRGVVTPEREAVVSLNVHSLDGNDQQVEAVIDTGFNDFLTLPPQLVSALRLPYAASTEAKLADGSIVEVPYFRAKVMWDGTLRNVLILALEGAPLVGMSLLYRYDLHIRVLEGGTVTITAAY
jgi:clan AA aspartic protease